MKNVARFCSLLLVLVVLANLCITVSAAGTVTYDGVAQKFIFEPDSTHSPTDLFHDFKNVMPGDSITQSITVKNTASDKVKVKIYMRSLGANEEGREFLSQLRLRVEKSDDNTMAYMFDAAADETAQLTDWVCLGTLYSGGEVNLRVILDVPVELDNAFQQQAGYLNWEFKVEEYEIEPTDPEPPKTGDNSQLWLWASLMLMSGTVLVFLIFVRKQEEKETQ